MCCLPLASLESQGGCTLFGWSCPLGSIAALIPLPLLLLAARKLLLVGKFVLSIRCAHRSLNLLPAQGAMEGER